MINEPVFVCDICGRRLGGMYGLFHIDVPNEACHEIKRYDLCNMCFAAFDGWLRKRINDMRGEDLDRS
jgi:hypothetical protein